MYEVNYLFLSANIWDAKCFLEQIRYTAVLIHNHQHEIALMLLGILLLPSSPHSFTFSETNFITHSPFLTNLSSTPSLCSQKMTYITEKEKLTDWLIFLSIHTCILSSLLFNRGVFLPLQQSQFLLYLSLSTPPPKNHTLFITPLSIWIFNIFLILSFTSV